MKFDIDHDNQLIRVHDVPLRLNGVIKTVMGARHVRNTDDWTTPARYPIAVQLLNELRSAAPDLTQAFRDWVGTQFEDIKHVYSFQEMTDREGNARLLPLQRVAAGYLESAKSGILAYDMGGGKTVIACDTIASLPGHIKTILIVCPKTVIPTWLDHIHEWTTDVTPIVATDSSAARKKAIKQALELANKGRRVALIMNYESVWRHTRLAPYGNLRMQKCEKCDPASVLPVTHAKCETCNKELNEIHWDAVICDEAHRVINVTNQTRGIWYLTRNTDYVWALTGTPSRGTVGDFWSLLHLVDPDAFPSRQRFLDRYCVLGNDNWGNQIIMGVKPGMTQEFEQITNRYMLRKSFDEIMKGMADALGETYVPISRIVEQRHVEMSREQRALYNDIADNMFVTTDDGSVIWADNGLSELTRLLQCSSAMLKTEGEHDNPDNPYKVHMVNPSSKVKEVVKIVTEDLEREEPVIIFAVHRELVELIRDTLEAKGVSTAMIHGGIDAGDREIEIERFQNGSAQAIILTYATGSEGITLTRSRIQIRAQLSWSMILNKQSVHRNLRYGQEATVLTYIDLITEDSVESRVYDAYADKLDALEAIVQDAKRMKELISGK